MKKIYIVTNSPWPKRLPNGTEIIETTPRGDAKRGNWFVRKDGNLLFEDETDGKFKLFDGEFKEKL